jgi:hypothetical protein
MALKKKPVHSKKSEFFSKYKKEIEIGLLVIFVAVVILVRQAQPWGHTLSHNYPAFYNANDNFLNGYVTPEYVERIGNFRYMPPQVVLGYEDVVGYYPVMHSHLSAIFSLVSGLETYDATYIVVMILFISTTLLMYFIIKETNYELAIISLPFMLGIYHFSFEVAHAFGLWLFLIGASFMIGIIWCSTRLNEKWIFIPLALLLTANTLAHMPEMIFGLGFLGLLLAIKYLEKRKIELELIRNLTLGLLIFILLSGYYLIIFKNTWMKYMSFKMVVMKEPPFAPSWGVHFDSFGTFQWLLYAGILLGLLSVGLYEVDRRKFFENINVRRYSVALLAGLFFVFIGLGNYFGLERRAWQTRILWPVYLSPLLGLPIYLTAKKLIKKWRFEYSALVALILILIFTHSHSGELKGSLIDEETWEAIQWIDSTTPQNAKVYYFYVPLIMQDFSLWSSHRLSYHINMDDFIDGIENGLIKPFYSSVSVHDPSGLFAYRISLFSFGYHKNDVDFQDRITVEEHEMWNMDYYIFTISQNHGHPVLVQYNLAIRDMLLKLGAMTEVFNNGVVSILKNNRSG